jgi:paraquat-inducible protein B
MGYQRFADQGPTVVLRMPEAEGIEADKTLVKARNVEVGRVVDVRLSDDLSHTLVEARLRSGADRMLNAGTDFWVVKPRIGSEGISGLNTVLSGAYIALRPGHSDKPQRRFKVLDSPPVTGSGEEGLRITLVSDPANALSEGDPVNYHGRTVGRVASVRFDADAREIIHEAFIRPEYTNLIRANTRFWVDSGVSISYEANGFNARFSSLETLLGGGLSLDLPQHGEPGAWVGGDHRFSIYASRAAANDGLFDEHIAYVMLVDGSVRGLSAGSPVRYRGVRLGTVVAAPWRYEGPVAGDSLAQSVPVLVHIEPGRIAGPGAALDAQVWRQRFEGLIEDGLRGSLRSSNLITGTSYVSLDVHEDAEPTERSDYAGHTVLPSRPGGVAHLEKQVAEFTEKLNNLEIQPALDSLQASASDSRATFDSVERTAESLESLLADPALRRLPAEIDATLAKLRSTLAGIDQDSALYHQLNETLKRLEAVMKDAGPLVRTLRDQPNALIFDKRRREDPKPRAPSR